MRPIEPLASGGQLGKAVGKGKKEKGKERRTEGGGDCRTR